MKQLTVTGLLSLMAVIFLSTYSPSALASHEGHEHAVSDNQTKAPCHQVDKEKAGGCESCEWEEGCDCCEEGCGCEGCKPESKQ
jgi:hypothetical protein